MYAKCWIKRSTALLLTLVLVLGLLGTGASAASSIVANGYCGGQSSGKNLSWVLYSSGKLAFFGSGPMADYESYRNTPWYSYRKQITSVSFSAGMTTIGDYAFYNCMLEGELTLPAALTAIGDCAFYGCDLEGELALPDTLTSIGSFAFYNCNLDAVSEIPAGVSSIGSGVFSQCGRVTELTVSPENETYSSYCGAIYDKALTTAVTAPGGLPEFIFPETLTAIGPCAFDGCYMARASSELIIPEGVVNIGVRAFQDCHFIEDVSLPASLQFFGSFVFEGCTMLESFSVAADNSSYCAYNGLLYNKEQTELIMVPGGLNDVPALAQTTKTICDRAFMDCSGMTGHLIIPESVEYIGRDAMYDCDSVIGIYFMGNAPEAYDDESFPDDVALYYIEGKTGWTDSEYYDETDGTWMYHPLHVWDGNAEDLGTRCGPNLNWELSADNTILTITGTGDMYDFARAASSPWYDIRKEIETVILPEGMTSIGDYAFYQFTAAELDHIPEAVTSIGQRAFWNWNDLTTVNISANVEEIGYRAFGACHDLTEITVAADNENYSSYNGLLCNKAQTELIRVPAGLWDAPVLVDTLTSIDDDAFYGCNEMKGYLIIPAGISFLGEEALYDCEELSGICFMGNAPEIEDDVFPENIPLYYLDGKTGWTDSEAYDEILGTWNGYPLSVWDGNKDTFSKSGYCGGEGDGTNLTWTVDLAANTLTISGTGAMVEYFEDEITPWAAYTAQIKTVIFEEGVTTIAGNAFARNTFLTEVVLPSSMPEVEIGTFYGCTNLEKATIGDGTDVISAGVFAKCTKLSTVAIPASVTLIGNGAFYECSALTDVYYGGTEDQWNAIDIYEGNEALTNATIHFAQAPVETFAIAGANMTLGNELVMNIMVKASDLAEGTYTAKISHGGKEPVELAFKTYNSTYCYVPYSVAAKEMTDTISVEVYNEDGVLVSEPFTRTVKQYAMTMLNNADQPDKLKSVIVDMLNYGTEAQKYFGYNEEAYANADVTAQQQAAYATADVECVNNQQAITNVAGASLSLEDSILMNVFFKVAYSETLTATISFTDYLGRDVTAEAELSKYGSMTKVVVDRIVLADAKRPVTVTVYDGETVVGQGVESVESYIARNLTNSSTGAINMAIMKFATSAYNYLGGTN